MLAIQKPGNASKACTVNVLPCSIHHNGPMKVTKRHWAPMTENDGTKTSYFRGRKLKGKVLRLPAGYTGVTVKRTERSLAPETNSKGSTIVDDESDDEVQAVDEIPESVKMLDVDAHFNDIVVWGHDQVPGNDDTFVRGLEEWLAFANAIHRIETHRP